MVWYRRQRDRVSRSQEHARCEVTRYRTHTHTHTHTDDTRPRLSPLLPLALHPDPPSSSLSPHHCSPRTPERFLSPPVGDVGYRGHPQRVCVTAFPRRVPPPPPRWETGLTRLMFHKRTCESNSDGNYQTNARYDHLRLIKDWFNLRDGVGEGGGGKHEKRRRYATESRTENR